MSDKQKSDRGMRDSRTLLPLRNNFYKDVEPLLHEASSLAKSLVLLVIDVDGIDFVLRTFGPKMRDDAIRIVGDRIQQTAGEGNTPYHITQNRFAVILTETSYKHTTKLARALVDVLRETVDIAGIPYRLEANVGISHYPNHADSINEMVRTAVFACHHARQARSDYATFDNNLDEKERYRFRLMLDLEQALDEQNGIRLAYQPMVDLETGRCVGTEGLCRWDHREEGAIPPGNFLPFVEHTSLIMPLTETILGKGLNDLAVWRRRGFTGKLSINLSPSLFRYVDLLERLFEQFRFFNINPKHVNFEITETGMMEQPNQAINTLMAIRERGCHIAVDDFGTGHSSLAYLADLPIDTIKIDRHFVQNLELPWGEAIVGAAATLADKLNLITVAEGIEDEWQYRKCHELGITLGQGYYIGCPMFNEDLWEWMEVSHTST